MRCVLRLRVCLLGVAIDLIGVDIDGGLGVGVVSRISKPSYLSLQLVLGTVARSMVSMIVDRMATSAAGRSAVAAGHNTRAST